MAEQQMQGVGGRFVTEADLKVAEERRKAEWDAAYERIGQKAPPREEAPYDPRTLFEQLEAHKAAEEAEWAERAKLSAQYRGLDEEESAFLQGMRDKERKAEEEREREVAEELERYKAVMAAREPPIPVPSTSAPATKSAKPAPAKKPSSSKPSQKALLASLIKKPAPKKRPTEPSKSAS